MSLIFLSAHFKHYGGFIFSYVSTILLESFSKLKNKLFHDSLLSLNDLGSLNTD